MYSQSLPTKKEQYDFLKWYLVKNSVQALSDTLKHFNYHVDLKDFFEINSYDKQLKISQQDSLYIIKQLNYTGKVLLDKEQFSDIDWKAGDVANLPVTYISLPVFSEDRTIAFINRAFHCGALCGHGGIEIYKKTDGKWKRYDIKFWTNWMN